MKQEYKDPNNLRAIPKERLIWEGEQKPFQFQEWRNLFDLAIACKKHELSELYKWSVLSNRYVLIDRQHSQEDYSFKLLEEYDLKEKITKMVRHVLDKVPESNKEVMLVNFITSLVGSAILHHDNKYMKKLQVPEFKETFGKQ